jgi:hypothetical protein
MGSGPPIISNEAWRVINREALIFERAKLKEVKDHPLAPTGYIASPEYEEWLDEVEASVEAADNEDWWSREAQHWIGL